MTPRVGDNIEVFWPKDSRYYAGEIVKYFPRSKKHRINYVDGWTELIDLAEHRWRKRRGRKKGSSVEREQLPGPLSGVGGAGAETTAFHGVGEELSKLFGSISDTMDRNISSLVSECVVAEFTDIKEKLVDEASGMCAVHLRDKIQDQVASTIGTLHESEMDFLRSAAEKSAAEIEARVCGALEKGVQDAVEKSASAIEARMLENVTHAIQKETLRAEKAIEARLEGKIERFARNLHISTPPDPQPDSTHNAVMKESAMARARKLVGMSATFWLMHYAGRDLPPADQELHRTWAHECAVMCLRFVTGKLNTFAGEDDAMRTWREKVDMVEGGVDLKWFLQPMSQPALSAARKNYASWNPPMGDKEWKAEIILLGLLSTRFEEAAVRFEKKNRKRTALEIAIAVSLNALKSF